MQFLKLNGEGKTKPDHDALVQSTPITLHSSKTTLANRLKPTLITLRLHFMKLQSVNLHFLIIASLKSQSVNVQASNSFEQISLFDKARFLKVWDKYCFFPSSRFAITLPKYQIDIFVTPALKLLAMDIARTC